MSKLLKDEINEKNIKKLAVLVNRQKASFDVLGFKNAILDSNWQALALKQRVRKITIQLGTYLDCSYLESICILKEVSVNFSGLFHFVFADFVEVFGVEDFETSMDALALFTVNSTSEFAIRVFLQKQPEKTKQQILAWSKSDNEHLRRLASEGVRPRLPWATHLPWIAENPNWVRPILENLKSDSSRYVQKSVANLINDLSKTQVDWVIQLCHAWQSSQSEQTQWIVKHALRTLLKQGNPKALALIGYSVTTHIKVLGWDFDKQVSVGEVWQANFALDSIKDLGLLRLEYALSFLRKHQSPYRKVFKIAEADYKVNHKPFQFKHNFKVISTRAYVPGKHKIELIMNGQIVKTAEFELIKHKRAAGLMK
ncbi:DNA alkylation repair protein [Thiomicrorhabdus lithotrophica]|uniref:DNA alkylation repair protein n=1 Tax=Thiomicrorhabdus lithotrophica TaxID=2949997 RepID=A0ABY8C6L7_9GAMM|nr:DNA alkylation repair protein [Thiomicrorhabdus lithotrophica]WEJ61616.1 DNA alkylation repair protein [Thiomicrorhabdus lithotrophica]